MLILIFPDFFRGEGGGCSCFWVVFFCFFFVVVFGLFYLHCTFKFLTALNQFRIGPFSIREKVVIISRGRVEDKIDVMYMEDNGHEVSNMYIF